MSKCLIRKNFGFKSLVVNTLSPDSAQKAPLNPN